MKYVSIPTEIEAVKVEWDDYNGIEEVWKFVDYNEEVLSSIRAFEGANFIEVFDKLHDSWIKVYNGQWLIRGTKGEYYPCDHEVFIEKYREV